MNLRFRMAGARSGGWLRTTTLITLTACAGLSTWSVAQSCPIESTAIEDAKPNKLYLYFPTVDDATFPITSCTLGTLHCFPTPVRPLKAFDITNIPDYGGTTSDLEDQVTKVVIDDYCEFNVKVLETTTVPPATFPRRVVVGLGTDSMPFGNGFLFGEARDVDTGDAVVVDSARVWAGTYETVAGAGGTAFSAA